MLKVCVFLLIVLNLLCSVSSQSGRSCTTPNGDTATCISIYSCPHFLQALRDRTKEQDEFFKKSQCGFANNKPLVCCGREVNFRAGSNIDENQSGNTGGNGNIFNNVADPGNRNFSPNPLIPSECGSQIPPRIFGGELTTVEEFPWMALLEYRTRTGQQKFSCGGALISNQYVLTAAHCVTGRILQVIGTLVSVRLGEWNITNSGQDCTSVRGFQTCNDPPINIPVDSSTYHSSYDERDNNRLGDIALVRLSRPVTFTSHIQPICLPSVNQESRVGENLIVAGWGKTEEGRNSPVKLKLEVPIFDKSRCASKFRTVSVNVGPSQICAGGDENKDSCSGDSGGPLMNVASGDIWYVEGVVSFGTTCGTRGWPGIYTKVSHYLGWIHRTVRR